MKEILRTVYCKNCPATAMQAPMGRGVSSYSFLTSVLDGGGDLSASRPGRALALGKDTDTHWTGGWVGVRAGLDTDARGKILYLCQGSNPSHSAVQIQKYTCNSVQRGCAMAQAVSLRPLTAESQVCVRVNPCGICDGQSGIGTGFSPSSSVFPCQYHSTIVLHTHISSGE
jgi:hypothetical protein